MVYDSVRHQGGADVYEVARDVAQHRPFGMLPKEASGHLAVLYRQGLLEREKKHPKRGYYYYIPS